MVKLPTLYSRTSKGAIQSWTIFIEDDKYKTEHGQVDGKLQTTNWTYAHTTNEGRANERNQFEQARFEAEALWKKKKDSGYHISISDIDSFTFVEPMLAKNYDDYVDKISYPVFAQPKLDGIRCIVTKDGMYSRNGKTINSCPHVREKLQYVFDQCPHIVLDGELYCDKLNNDFNKICSLVKKTKPTGDDLVEAADMIQYWIYDIVDTDLLFENRITLIEKLINTSLTIQKVPTGKLKSKDELDIHYGACMDHGFEGQMVRLNSTYENKRSKSLLKRKEFQDREYTILDIIEGDGNRTGMAGAMVFKNELGIEFNSNIKGDRAYLKELLDNKNEYIGREATVKYFNLTPAPNCLPRFPFVIKIREAIEG
jgi:DNA ligase 1